MKMAQEIEERLLKTEREDEESKGAPLTERLWAENKKMWAVAGPAIFTRFSTFGIGLISQVFIGHIGAVDLAAYSLVSTVLLRFANGVLVPFSFFSLLHP